MDVVIAIKEYFSGPLGKLELIATILLLANVYMLTRQNIWNYVPGMIGVVIYGWIFYQSNLYSDMILQWGFYVPVQIIGWYMWQYGGTQGKNTLPVTGMTITQQAVTIIAVLPMIFVFGTVTEYFGAHYAYPDAAIAVLSIAAQLLMLKKKVQSWVLWVIVDVIAIQVYYAKQLYVTSGLYVVFLMLAVYGLLTWLGSARRFEDAKAI